MIAAVHTRTLELSPEAALRVANADQELAKYNYNPDEPRDWHGRWTREGATNQTSPLVRKSRTRSNCGRAPHGRSMSRSEMTLCGALSKMHASLNVQNLVSQRMIMAGSSSIVLTTV